MGKRTAVTGLALWWIVQDYRRQWRSFAALYFAASSITALSAGKLGSTTNHFLEWMVASCLCAGLGYSLLITKHPAKAMPITVLLSVSVIVGVMVQNRQQPTREFVECGPAYQRVRDARSSAILSQSLGPLLSAGKPILISDPFIYAQLVQHGLWPDSRVEQLVNERYFGLIVMFNDDARMSLPGTGIWPASLLDAIARNYRTVNRFSCRDAGLILEPISPGPRVERMPVPSR